MKTEYWSKYLKKYFLIYPANSYMTMEGAHTKSIEETYKYYDVSPNNGLSDDAIEQSRAQHGYNGMLCFIFIEFY